ncbi:MAG: CocE/NonD family hydrolase [Anaerolineae bacterium]|jgi:hypothetical protein
MSNTSPTRYPTRVVKNVSIPMSDGTVLAADMVMPEAAGPFPVVFDYYPYRKDDLSADGLRRQRYLAERGYVAVRLDVRGTGSSTGIAEDEYVLQEQLDAVEAIDWMAQQPWSTGSVGMFGTSYGGFNSLQVAMHRPPALKAICPMYFTDNRYTDDCHYKGGALQMLFDLARYGLWMVVYNALPPHPQAPGLDWAATWEQRLEENEPWILNWLSHQTYDSYWKHGSLCEDYEAIQCAAFLIGGWRDGYTNCNLRTFQHLRCPKKLLIGPWLHAQPDTGVPGPNIDHLHETVRFFDHWLKGIDNGVMDEPPITIYVQDFDPPRADRERTSGHWRHELDWPLERSTERALYLSADDALQTEAPADAGVRRYTYNPSVGTAFGMFSASSPYLLPVDQRLDEPYSLSWTSGPLDEPVEILGRPRAVLQIAVGTDIATVVARLVDVAPDGRAALVTKGVLNLTHRESHERPTPVVPDRVYELAVRLDATSWRFQPGHRIRLSVAGADFPHTWPSPKPYAGEVQIGGKQASRLILPVVTAQRPSLPTPQLPAPVAFEPVGQVEAERPTWRVTRDHMAATTEVFLHQASRTHIDGGPAFASHSEATATVFERDPARATIRGLSQVVLHWPKWTIDASARGQIESTEDSFHVTIHLEITRDGSAYFNRRWTRTFPRELL